MDKIINFLSQGPILGAILIVSVLLIVPAKDKPVYFGGAIIGLVMAFFWEMFKHVTALSE